MNEKPKIKLTLNPFDKKIETAAFVLLIVLWGITLFAYINLPQIIPIHFNAVGKPDHFGSKLTLFVLPVIGSVIYSGISFLNRCPHIFNYPVTITALNAVEQYTIATRVLRLLKLSINLLFCIIVIFTYLTSIGLVDGLGYWFLPFVLLLCMGPTGYFIYKSLKNKTGLK